MKNGGIQIAELLRARGIDHLFTLCGGHISPILVAAKQAGIRVIDVRHEATAVFAADAYARLTGVPGVAAVTAGPGLTNTLTAVKNAQLAQSPVVILGGATATALKNRGALQDIDQRALMEPHVKQVHTISRVRDLAPAVADALSEAQSGVPGPVFVECPVDLLYDRDVVAEWYGAASGGKSLNDRLLGFYLSRKVQRLFSGVSGTLPDIVVPQPQAPDERRVETVIAKLRQASRPVIVCGSQAVAESASAGVVAQALEAIGAPVYLSGMARGLLGPQHPLHMRHKRREAIRSADLVVLAGVPCDFRLDYGRQIRRSATLVSANRSRHDLRLNRRPTIGVLADPGLFLQAVARGLAGADTAAWAQWADGLRQRDADRESEIATSAETSGDGVNPLALLRTIDSVLPDHAMLVADGGDFVGTASYIVRPRGPLRWLDPGAFGTLGVGGGFALGAAAACADSDAEIWILYGDGSAGYSIAEFDTYVRHGIPVIAVVGNDACWAQIAREQVKLLGDDTGVRLARTDYHRVAEGFGAAGVVIRHDAEVADKIAEARRLHAEGRPVLVNVHLAGTDFREGSISI
jgi:acetolactate synthase-1/2/3 large subunit